MSGEVAALLLVPHPNPLLRKSSRALETNIQSSINFLNRLVSKLWFRGHLRTFGHVEIQFCLFEVLKRPRFEAKTLRWRGRQKA